MPVVHYLNVGNGDCSIIRHVSGNISVIDVNLAKKLEKNDAINSAINALQNYRAVVVTNNTEGNYNQKANPENPIKYLTDHSINKIFRFILTHPDCDHFGGLKNLFEELSPTNFWDIDNNKEGDGEDWDYYEELKDNKHCKRLLLLRGSRGQFYNKDELDEPGGDGLYVLSPTQELIDEAKEADDYNDASYMILYRAAGGRKILFCGDAHDATWESVLNNCENDVKDVDVLIAPHHGRASDRDYSFLDVVNPKLTLFGNADSKDLAYDAWNSRDLKHITNNQAGNIILNITDDQIGVYVTNEKFAKDENSNTFWNNTLKGFFIYCV